jgi:hypothetical protein
MRAETAARNSRRLMLTAKEDPEDDKYVWKSFIDQDDQHKSDE